MKMYYIYHGDKLTCPTLRKKPCKAIKKENGKCIRGKNSNMLVAFENGVKVVVMARMLRKIKFVV